MNCPIHACRILLGVFFLLACSPQISSARKPVPLAQLTPVASPVGTPATEVPTKDNSDAPVPAVEPAEELPPGTVRVYLHDGSVITGILANKSIEVATKFGRLTVPVDQIVSFTPGLDSQTQRMEDLKKLIDQLGDSSYSARDTAEKQLLAMGLKIRNELEMYRNDKNAERKTRVQKILAAMADLEDDETPDDGNEKSQPWKRLDVVMTQPFTLAGRIDQKQFQLASKYGQLNIALADIQRVERPRRGRESYRRTVAVAGTNIVPRQYKNSNITIQAGDRITIKADGVLQMTPWGTGAMSTPEGAPNYGWFVNAKIPSGALVMRVGNNDQPIKVGSSYTFTAKKAGTLQFGIGMNSSYVNHSFPGTYNLKISVRPAGK